MNSQCVFRACQFGGRKFLWPNIHGAGLAGVGPLPQEGRGNWEGNPLNPARETGLWGGW